MPYFAFILLACLSITGSAQANDTRQLNFMIFEKADASFSYDPIMFGSFSQFIRDMQQTHLLLLSHNPQVINKDIISLQQDVLQNRHDSDFQDDGINCQLSFHDHDDEGDPINQLAGSCQIITHFKGQAVTLRVIIPTTDLPDSAKGTNVWIELYEDKKTGIAFYANVSQ